MIFTRNSRCCNNSGKFLRISSEFPVAIWTAGNFDDFCKNFPLLVSWFILTYPLVQKPCGWDGTTGISYENQQNFPLFLEQREFISIFAENSRSYLNNGNFLWKSAEFPVALNEQRELWHCDSCHGHIGAKNELEIVSVLSFYYNSTGCMYT